MKTILLLLLLIGLSSSYNTTKCDNCIQIVEIIQNNTYINKYLSYLNILCKITNNTKCEKYISEFEYDIKNLNADDICYNIGFCDRLNFKSLIATSYHFPIILSVPYTCLYTLHGYDNNGIIQVYVGYFKYYNKLIAMYDMNRYDKDNCYIEYNQTYIKRGINLKSLWEIEFDSEILYFYNSQTIQGYLRNTTNDCHKSLYNVNYLQPDIYIIGTRHYQYYISSDGNIITKIKIGVTLQRPTGWWNRSAISPPYLTPFSNISNAIYITTDNTLYSINYMERLNKISANPDIAYCNINDVKIKQVFSLH